MDCFFLLILLIGAALAVFNYAREPDVPTYRNENTSRQHREFINKLLPETMRVKQTYNILPSITLAQAILESDWGQSELAAKYYNLFGVKAEPDQPNVELQTTEFTNGTPSLVKGRFRVYQNWDESIAAHAKLLAYGTDWNREQYKNVVQTDDYQAAALALSQSGYATDPSYSQKIINIIQKYHLDQYDQMAMKEKTR